MTTPRTLVIRTAGTNCDEETCFAFQQAGAATELVHVNRLAETSDPFADFQILAIPGGFTYGDDVAAGRVLAVQIAHVFGDKLTKFIENGGLVIGICNGFQALVKTGFLPGTPATDAGREAGSRQQTVTLTANDSHKFESRWVHLATEKNTRCVFADPTEELELPVAHGEGKFITGSQGAADKLAAAGQVVYRYTSGNGNGHPPEYPADPNGSEGHIAGICDTTGRVFGLMPHPERHLFGYHHPRWTREPQPEVGAGLRIFERAVQYCQKG